MKTDPRLTGGALLLAVVGPFAVAVAIAVGMVLVGAATGVWDTDTQSGGRQSLTNFVAIGMLFLGLAVMASGVVMQFVEARASRSCALRGRRW